MRGAVMARDERELGDQGCLNQLDALENVGRLEFSETDEV
jgi:hypothetical protein